MEQSESQTAKQFQDALEHIQIMKNKSAVKIEDVNYLLGIGDKLLMEFKRRTESRAKWRLRAETAEAKLK